MRAGSVELALERLRTTLADVRRRATAEEWGLLIETARAHPLRDVLHQDPFLLRCHAKPRGYSGDPTALDYVLRAPEVTVPPRGRAAQFHALLIDGPLARALRFRRDGIARTIDEIAAHAERPLRVLAVGAGHLRELDRMRAITEGRIAQLVAFDADPECLATVRRDYAHLPVVAHHGSVRQLVEDKGVFVDMDLVYCAGILETLVQAPAAGLVRALFAMLRPGGTLLLTNFHRDLADLGLLETFMDWRMVTRGESELFDLVKPIAQDAVSSWTYNADRDSTMGFITVIRRGTVVQ